MRPRIMAWDFASVTGDFMASHATMARTFAHRAEHWNTVSHVFKPNEILPIVRRRALDELTATKTEALELFEVFTGRYMSLMSSLITIVSTAPTAIPNCFVVPRSRGTGL